MTPPGGSCSNAWAVFILLSGCGTATSWRGGCSQISDGILIWLESGELSYCLFVDELLGEQQVVVKPLPSYLSRFNIKQSGIAGCTILGDGNISIILDISNLYTPA